MNWKQFFDALGMNGTKWQWRIIRWQESWRSRRETWRQQRGTVAYKHKFCNECRALLDRNDTACHRCGAKASSWRSQAIGRFIGMVIPSPVPVSSAILGVNILFFVAIVAMDGPQALMRPSLEVMRNLGAMVPILFYEGEYWRVITCGYLHFGIIHIGFNMLVLSQVGPMLEEEIGAARFFTVYTVSLAGGVFLGLVIRGPVAIHVAGASGALFGLVGFGAAYAHSRGRGMVDVRNFFLRWAFYVFLFGFFIRADNWGHLGGFMSGGVLGFLVERQGIHRARFTFVWIAAMYCCLALTLAAFAWMLVTNV